MADIYKVKVPNDSTEYDIRDSRADGLGSAAYKAETDFALAKLLTNEDLNTVKTAGLYRAQSNNSVTNKPSGVNGFGLEVIPSADNYCTQVLYKVSSEKSYRRYCKNNTWTDWVEDKFTDTDTYDRNLYNAAIKCDSTAIVAGNIIVGKNGLYHQLNNGETFYITYPILYAASAIAAGATGTNNYNAIPCNVSSISSSAFTAYLPVYIKGSLSGVVFTPDSTTPLTQTVPTSGDGKYYILLGIAYNTTNIYLQEEHPIYAYKNGKFREDDGITSLVAGTNIALTPDTTDNTITITASNDKVKQSKTSGANWRKVALGYQTSSSQSAAVTEQTNQVYVTPDIEFLPGVGALYAKGYTRNNLTDQTVDLNDLILHSNKNLHYMGYICKTDAGSANITNKPINVDKAFILDVELIKGLSETYSIRQTFATTHETDCEYVRYYIYGSSSGSWTDWTKRLFMTSDERSKLNEISTGANKVEASTTNGNIKIDSVETTVYNDIPIWKAQGKLGAKNLIPYPYYHTTKTASGIDITDNGDGSVTFDGTASASATIFRYTNNDANVEIPLGNFKYLLTFGYTSPNNAFHLGDMTLQKADGTTGTFGEVLGDTIIDNTDGTYVGIRAMGVYVAKNKVIDNVTLYPMLRIADDTDSTYRIYAKTNRELTVETTSIKTKLDTIEEGAEVNVQSDFLQNDNTADDYIKNKPTLGTAAAKDYTTSVTQNSVDLVTSGAVWSAIEALPEPMIMKGTLGTDGTITTLPTASSANEGFVYKVITAGTYAGQAAKVGDFFVCCDPDDTDTYSWIWFPSGDESFTDTWRNIKVNGTEQFSNSISSGAVDFVNGSNTTVTYTSTGKKISISTNVQNNLTSDSTTDALTAAQGKALATGSARDDTKLALTGGTVTGDINRKHTSVDATLANNGITANTYPTTFNIVDKNGLILTRKEAVIKPTGEIEAYWYVRNYNGSTSQVAQKGIRMSMDKTGTLTYQVSDASNFRDAISAVTGSGTSGYLAKFNGSNSITNGPELGSGTSKYLRENGTWATPTNTYDRIYYNKAVMAGAAITSGTIIVADSNGSYYMLKDGVPFDISYPILYCNSDRSSAGTTGTNNYLVMPVAITAVQSMTLTAYQNIYIKGSFDGKIFTPENSTPLTQTIPTTDDGKFYMYLGTAYDTSNFYLIEKHPIYAYKNGKFGEVVNSANSVNGYTVEKNVPSNAIFTDAKVTQTADDSTNSDYFELLFSNSSNNITLTEGTRKSSKLRYNPSTGSLMQGNSVDATGTYSHAEGYGAWATANYTHAEGNSTLASNESAHAEGYNTTASGQYSHGEGWKTSAYGESAHAEGYWTIAKGARSHAEGDETSAYGDYSHAEGTLTLANGNSTHAEGDSTQSLGTASHAEGYQTSASGNYSHAEGQGTTASGNNSHSEGYKTRATEYATHTEGEFTSALGRDAHAEGCQTYAKGDYSHAEGQSTTASGRYAHAEGYNTVASEDYSHAEGGYTLASNVYSHAEGKYTTASGYYSHAEGNYTSASNNNSHTEGYKTTASGISSHSEGGYTTTEGLTPGTTASGDNSHAEGLGTVANAEESHAEGYYSTASGDYSHAEGYQTSASGNYTHAEGGYSTAYAQYSHVEGYQTSTGGNGSHAEGSQTYTLGHSAHAEGQLTTANGNYSHSEGKYTLANGSTSHAEGYYTTSYAQYTHAEGIYTYARNHASHAEGYYTTSSGIASHAEGGYTTAEDRTPGTFAIGDNSHAEGLSTVASAAYSHAEGLQTTSYLNASHAEGWLTSAGGSASHAEGCATSTGNQYAHAEGHYTYASVQYSHAEGDYTTASGIASHAEGGYGTSSVGTLASGASSHAEGYSTTASGIASHTEGGYATTGTIGSLASGNNSHAEGRSKATGESAHAEGAATCSTKLGSHSEGGATTAYGNYAHSEGYQTRASAQYAHAEGQQTRATSNYAHSEGFNSTANGVGAHAGGYKASANNPYSRAIGHFNAAMTTGGNYDNQTGTAFVIGNGTAADALSNAFSVDFDGTVKAASTITASTTADYAEYFEWSDENPQAEDRIGYFVTFDEENKIRFANSNDDYILGVSSGAPFVLGNGDCDVWNGMYLRDEFNRIIYEPAPKMSISSNGKEYYELDANGNLIYEGVRPKLNPDYDPTIPYINRSDRPEWCPIGMLGVLAVRDDGTCQVNGYATVNENAIATKFTGINQNKYRVIKRKTQNVIEIVFR